MELGWNSPCNFALQQFDANDPLRITPQDYARKMSYGVAALPVVKQPSVWSPQGIPD